MTEVNDTSGKREKFRLTPDPLRDYISELATDLVVRRVASMEELALNVGWANHPDSELSEAQEIAATLERRADVAQ